MAKARTRRSLCERTSVSVSKMRSPPSASTGPARKMPKMATMAAKIASFLFPTNMVVMAAMYCDGFAALSCVEAVGMTTSEEDFLISTRFACVCVHSTSKLIGALFYFGNCGLFKTRKDLGSCDEAVVACSTCSSRPGLRAYVTARAKSSSSKDTAGLESRVSPWVRKMRQRRRYNQPIIDLSFSPCSKKR